jgi:hypothetical protein
VSLQLTIVLATMLLKTATPVPCDAPKPDPVNVTCMPGESAVGDILASVGGTMVNGIELLGVLF